MAQNAPNMANWPVYRRQSSRVGSWHTPADFESRPVDVSAYTYRLAATAPTADSNFESAVYHRLTPTNELPISTHLPTNADLTINADCRLQIGRCTPSIMRNVTDQQK